MFDEFNHIAFRNQKKNKACTSRQYVYTYDYRKNEDDYYFIPRNRNLYHLPGDKKIPVFGY